MKRFAVFAVALVLLCVDGVGADGGRSFGRGFAPRFQQRSGYGGFVPRANFYAVPTFRAPFVPAAPLYLNRDIDCGIGYGAAGISYGIDVGFNFFRGRQRGPFVPRFPGRGFPRY
jgi:hypothetical protein